MKEKLRYRKPQDSTAYFFERKSLIKEVKVK